MITETKEIFYDILNDHLRRYPLIEAEDIYKLIHQAAMGSRHAVGKPYELIVESINEEWNKGERIPPGSRLLDIIDPAGKMMRVDIRLFKKAGGTPEKLAAIFYKSAETFIPDQNYLIQLMDWALKWADERAAFIKDKMRIFFKKQQDLNCPVSHHSRVFFENYRPAYRIADKRLWQDVRL